MGTGEYIAGWGGITLNRPHEFDLPRCVAMEQSVSGNVPVIPKWAERSGGFGSEPVDLYNEKIAPITGLYVVEDGTVEKR